MSNSSLDLTTAFLPVLLRAYGATTIQIGLAFALPLIAVICCSMPFSYLATKVGRRKEILYTAMACQGFLTMLYGFVAMVPLFLLLRFVQGIATSAADTMAYSLVSTWFPGETVGALRDVGLGSGMAFLVGPIIGGLLFSFGGVLLTYLSWGTALLVAVPRVHITISLGQNIVAEGWYDDYGEYSPPDSASACTPPLSSSDASDAGGDGDGSLEPERFALYYPVPVVGAIAATCCALVAANFSVLGVHNTHAPSDPSLPRITGFAITRILP